MRKEVVTFYAILVFCISLILPSRSRFDKLDNNKITVMFKYLYQNVQIFSAFFESGRPAT